MLILYLSSVAPCFCAQIFSINTSCLRAFVADFSIPLFESKKHRYEYKEEADYVVPFYSLLKIEH